MKTIEFNYEVGYKGRNGFGRQHGIGTSLIEQTVTGIKTNDVTRKDVIHLNSINSKDLTGSAMLQIPKENLLDFINDLIFFYNIDLIDKISLIKTSTQKEYLKAVAFQANNERKRNWFKRLLSWD